MGVWHQVPVNQFLDRTEKPVRKLRGIIEDAYRSAVRETGGLSDIQPWISESWIQFYKNGDYKVLHNHERYGPPYPDDKWAGGYYIDDGAPDESMPYSGVFAFSIRNVKYFIRPRPGLLMLWPADVLHEVHPLWREIDTEFAGRPCGRAVRERLAPPYFRVLVGSVLSRSTIRAIYLDADVVVNADLVHLWRRPLRGAIVGAVVDYLSRCRDAVRNWQALGLDGDSLYYNSGVMLIDLDAWRREDVGIRALTVCQENPSHLLAQNEFAQHEQYGLNVVLQGNWETVSTPWNWGSELTPCPARIIHYLGNGKPHDHRCQPRFRELFQSHLIRTEWREWWPAGPEAGTGHAEQSPYV